MKISIVTPSYNQAVFLEKTLESIVTQKGDFELELLIMDAASKDGSVEIIEKYAEKYKDNQKIKIFWRSHKDGGQSDAINEGMKKATGDVFAFLNSDDMYPQGTLQKVAEAFTKNPDIRWLTGRCGIIDENNNPIQGLVEKYKNMWLGRYFYSTLLMVNYISQPATFWRKEVMEEFGYFDESLVYTMDYDYWLRIGKKYRPIVLKQELALFRIHSLSKGGSNYVKQFQENTATVKKYTKNIFMLGMHILHDKLTVLAYKVLKK